MGTYLHPTAGYIPNFASGSLPGELKQSEKEYLRGLAAKVAEISQDPAQKEKRSLWYNHNALKKVRPMLLVFPEDSWVDIINETSLKIKDPFWKQWEWYLQHLIYRNERILDDFGLFLNYDDEHVAKSPTFNTL